VTPAVSDVCSFAPTAMVMGELVAAIFAPVGAVPEPLSA
jgi:hypothetical protein